MLSAASILAKLKGTSPANYGLYKYPATVASANDLNLTGKNGGFFSITGTTTINGIKKDGLAAGSYLVLDFAGASKVANNASPSTGYAKIYTASGADETPTANQAMLLIYDGTAFHEPGVIGAGTTAIQGVAANYKIARGVTALDGSNPTPVTTGLTTVVAATVSLEGTAAPGVGTSVLTIASTNYASGALAVYAWKVTSSEDTTLIASTGTENFEWIAVGT